MLEVLNPYFWAVAIRNRLYDTGVFKIKKLPVPVISVGNLSVGGSGKTSLVKYLCETLDKYFCIGIVSRGYKKKVKELLKLLIKAKFFAHGKKQETNLTFLLKC